MCDYVVLIKIYFSYMSISCLYYVCHMIVSGCLDLTFVRKIGKCSLLSMFLQFETGGHVDTKALEYIKVKGLRLTPKAKR